MKLSILLAGSILTSAIVGNAYAQTCGAQPSCSSLGYTYTGSTSDCVNTPMKCPFNTSYFNCTKKADALAKLQADIVTAAMPDYSRAQSRNKGQQYTASNNKSISGCRILLSRNKGQQYTASTNGFIIGYDRYLGSKSWDSNVKVIINGQNVRVIADQTEYTINTWSYPVKKGSTYQVTSGDGEIKYMWVPTY